MQACLEFLRLNAVLPPRCVSLVKAVLLEVASALPCCKAACQILHEDQIADSANPRVI